MLRILHGADLHLDSPFAALPPEQAQARRKLQRQLPDRIADLCLEYGCDLLLLAGDVFDGKRVCPETIQALRSALGRCGARVFIAPGNHDPYEDDSPWAVTVWPDNVHIFTEPSDCVTLPDLGCRIWGGAFLEAVCFEPLPRVQSRGLLEIGVYHGDPTHSGPYRYLPEDLVQQCGLDYLALGHVHKPQLPRQMGKTWVGWPGVAMGRGFDECGAHGVFLTELDHGSCKTTALTLPGPRYECITVGAGAAPELPADSENVICRLTVTGESDPPDLEALYEMYAPRFLTLEVRDETTPPPDLWSACGDGTLRGMTMEILKTRYDGGDSKLAALAARYVLAALEGRDAP